MTTLAPRADEQQADADADGDRLLNLFWNRARLKAELERLRRERFELQDRIRQQEGEMLRLAQRYERLEGLLADPLEAANVGVYYQLRALWFSNRRRLAALAQDLADHQLALEHDQLADRASRRREAVRARIDADIAALRAELRQVRGELRVAEQRDRGWRRLLSLGVRGSDTLDLAARTTELEAALAGQVAARAAALKDDPAPLPSLGLAGRRRVNLAVLAMAQELLLHFAADDLARLAREAIARPPGDASYGDRRACRRLSGLVAGRLQALAADTGLVTRVRRRSRFLASCARYARDDDAVPVAGTFAMIPLSLDEAGAPTGPGAHAVNVLVEEYWDLFSLLLR